MKIYEAYGKAIKQLYEASEECKNLAKQIQEKIPQGKCEKGKLLAITLGNNVSSLDELTSMLEAKIEYLDSSDINVGQELARFHDMYKALEKYFADEIQARLHPPILDVLQGKAPTDYDSKRG